MKKILLNLIPAMLLSVLVKAQIPTLQVNLNQANTVKSFPPSASNPNNIVTGATDTLEYFFNKHYYRNPTTANANTNFYSLTQPYPGTVSITHCGALFLNTAQITVNGLEGIVFKNTSSPSTNVPIHLYLCTINGSNLPNMPPLDSVVTSVGTSTAGNWVGGNFATPIPINGKFAVLFRIMSTNPLDTVRLFINNAATATSTMVTAQKYGEGLGLMRYNGVFYPNTNIFGTGTDYEFIVAPRVSFNFTAAVNVQTSTICTNAYGAFTSASTPTNLIENRQFNFNKFKAKWPPFNTLIPTTDSIYNWTFSGSPTGPLTGTSSNAFFNVTGIQTASLTVKYRKSTSNAAFLTTVSDIGTNTINVSSTSAPTLAISGGGTICSGSSVTLTASGNVTYTWTSPASNATSIVVSPASNTTYTVLGVNGACVASQTVQVAVSTPPFLNVVGTSSVCAGVTYSVMASGANSYLWSNSATTSSITGSSTVAGVQSFTVTGTNAPCPSATLAYNVTINAFPSVSLTAASNTLCSKATNGSSITLNGTPVGGNYSGTNVSNGVFTPNSAGSFISTYSYTDVATGCSKSATTTILVTNCTSILESEVSIIPQVFPNPTSNGIVTINNLQGASNIEVYSLLGNLIVKQSGFQNDTKVNLSSYDAGCYFLKINYENGNSKLLKIVNQH